MLRVKKPQDLGAGILFVLFGIAGLWFGRDFTVGTAARMGPGYFPMLLSGLLILFGIIIGARSLVLVGAPIATFRWRSGLLVLIAIVMFGLSIQRLGLAVAAVAVTIAASLADRRNKPWEMAALGVLMAVFCVGVFIYGLNQPLPLWADD